MSCLQHCQQRDSQVTKQVKKNTKKPLSRRSSCNSLLVLELSMDLLKNICPASSHQQHPRAKTNKQTTLQFFITAVQNILLFVLSLLFLLLPALSSGLQFKYRKKQLRTSPHTLSPGHSEFFKSPFHHTFSRIRCSHLIQLLFKGKLLYAFIILSAFL